MEVVKELPKVRMRPYKIQSGLDMIGEKHLRHILQRVKVLDFALRPSSQSLVE